MSTQAASESVKAVATVGGASVAAASTATLIVATGGVAALGLVSFGLYKRLSANNASKGTGQ